MMKKILFVTILSLIFVTKTFAGNDDEFVSLQAGFLFNNTLNASFGYEKELRYDNAYEFSETWGVHSKEEAIPGGKNIITGAAASSIKKVWCVGAMQLSV